MLKGMGLLDDFQTNIVTAKMNDTMSYLKDGQFVLAFDGWNSVFGDYGGNYTGKSFDGSSLFFNFTGGSNTENIAYSGADPAFSFNGAVKFLNVAATRKAIHIGNLPMGQVDQYHIMIESGDVMNTSKPYIEALLSANLYKVLAYNGNRDAVVGAQASEALYSNMNWPGQSLFLDASRVPYRVRPYDKEVAGFARTVIVHGNQFTRVVIRNAGHMVPADQGRATFDMIDKFISNQPFHEQTFNSES